MGSAGTIFFPCLERQSEGEDGEAPAPRRPGTLFHKEERSDKVSGTGATEEATEGPPNPPPPPPPPPGHKVKLRHVTAFEQDLDGVFDLSGRGDKSAPILLASLGGLACTCVFCVVPLLLVILLLILYKTR